MLLVIPMECFLWPFAAQHSCGIKNPHNQEVHWIFNRFVVEAIWCLILAELLVSLEAAGFIPFNIALCRWSGTRNHPISNWQELLEDICLNDACQ